VLKNEWRWWGVIREIREIDLSLVTPSFTAAAAVNNPLDHLHVSSSSVNFKSSTLLSATSSQSE
jgi:hypothetical protein